MGIQHHWASATKYPSMHEVFSSNCQCIYAALGVSVCRLGTRV